MCQLHRAPLHCQPVPHAPCVAGPAGDSKDAPPPHVYEVLKPVLVEKEKAEGRLKVGGAGRGMTQAWPHNDKRASHLPVRRGRTARQGHATALVGPPLPLALPALICRRRQTSSPLSLCGRAV